MAGSSNVVFQASSYWQVLKTSTDPCQQFSAPFKAGNSRQVQTCYISQEYNTKKLQDLNWFRGMLVCKHGRDWEIATENRVVSIRDRVDFDSSRFGLKPVNLGL